MIKFAVIGYGYWGPNIVRNLMGIDGAVVAAVCDTDSNNLKKAKSTTSEAKVSNLSKKLRNSITLQTLKYHSEQHHKERPILLHK